ncbi:hypothetical protein MXB_2504 [Myxobolus squamalis]|nr:hypothetical protein MXB_2504 [Myxobolus squamalis]
MQLKELFLQFDDFFDEYINQPVKPYCEWFGNNITYIAKLATSGHHPIEFLEFQQVSIKFTDSNEQWHHYVPTKVQSIISNYFKILTKSSFNEKHKKCLSYSQILQLFFDFKLLYIVLIQNDGNENYLQSLWDMISGYFGVDCAFIVRALDVIVAKYIQKIMYLLEPIMTETAISTIRTLSLEPIPEDMVLFSTEVTNKFTQTYMSTITGLEK